MPTPIAVSAPASIAAPASVAPPRPAARRGFGAVTPAPLPVAEADESSEDEVFACPTDPQERLQCDACQ